MGSGCPDHLPYGLLRDLCKRQGYRHEDAQGVLKTRLASMLDKPASSTQNLATDAGAPLTGAALRVR